MRYYHSYHTTTETMENLQQQLQLTKEDATTAEKADAKPNLDIFQELLQRYPVRLLSIEKGKWEHT